MKHFLCMLLTLPFVGLSLSCQTTSEFENFREIHLGMEKGQVVEAIGSPKHSERHDEKDWWYYGLHQDGTTLERMVIFTDGKVIYAGRVTTPTFVKPAEKVDHEHDVINQGIAPVEERERVEQNTLPDGVSAPAGETDQR